MADGPLKSGGDKDPEDKWSRKECLIAFATARAMCYRLAMTVNFPSEGPVGLWVDLVDL